MPAVPKGHIIVPSLANIGTTGFRSMLIADKARFFTVTVGNPNQHRPMGASPALIKTKIDYYETTNALQPSRLRFIATVKPKNYLAVVNIRPLEINSDRRNLEPNTPNTPLIEVPAKTQMVATKDLRMNICSPTCLSMMLDYLDVAHDLNEIVVSTHHRATNLFGVWPQNIWALSRWGVIAAVETSTSWESISEIIYAGHPLVASIAFGKGTLDGSPLAESNGHLVIIRGIQNNEVVVNDPAARSKMEVPRRYDIDQFHRAWLATRGAFYLLAKNR